MKIADWQRDVAHYDFRHTLTSQYSHLDTLRHVNNVAVHGMHVEARVRYQLSVLGPDSLFSDAVLLRPRRTVTHFLRETHFPHDVVCAARLTCVTDRGYTLVTALFQEDKCVGIQSCDMGFWGGNDWLDTPDSARFALQSSLRGDASISSDWPEPPLATVALSGFPAAGEISLRYADLDPDLVVGELAASTFIEQSRSASLRPIRRTQNNVAGLGMLVASVDIQYHRWLRATTAVQTGCGVERLGNSSFALGSAVFAGETRLASARSTMVVIDQARRRPTPIIEPLRSAMTELLIDTSADPAS